METLKDALVFWYPEELQISCQPEKHYSGLTQAYYAEILFGAYQATGDESLRAASGQNGETGQPVRTVRIPAGRTEVEVPLPWDMVDLIAYPTNNPVFSQWADKWQGYVCDWSTMVQYKGLSVRDYRTDSDDIASEPASFYP